jgi:hypothetical protein
MMILSYNPFHIKFMLWVLVIDVTVAVFCNYGREAVIGSKETGYVNFPKVDIKTNGILAPKCREVPSDKFNWSQFTT